MPRYFVVPTLPRDVWFGYADKPELFEKAQSVAFVEQRHSHIHPAFDACHLADALNEKAESAALRQRVEELEEKYHTACVLISEQKAELAMKTGQLHDLRQVLAPGPLESLAQAAQRLRKEIFK